MSANQTAEERIAFALERIASALEKIASQQPTAPSQPRPPAAVRVDFTPPLTASSASLGDEDGQAFVDEIQAKALERISKYGDAEPATDKQYGLWCGKIRALLGSDEARHGVTATLAGVDVATLADHDWRPSKSECSAWLDWLLEPDDQHTIRTRSAAGIKAIWQHVERTAASQLELF